MMMILVRAFDDDRAWELSRWQFEKRGGKGSIPNTVKYSMYYYVDGRTSGLKTWGSKIQDPTQGGKKRSTGRFLIETAKELLY